MADPQIPFKRSSDIIDAANLPYTPTDLTKWTGSADPGSTRIALDQLASRVTTVETGVPAAEVTYTPAQTTDWPGADPTLVSGALDTTASRVTVLEAAVPAALATTLGRMRQVTVTAAAEAAEAIVLTIAITDGTGVAAAATRIRVFISTDVAGTSAVNAAAFVIADAGNGTIENADTGNAVWTCLTGASTQVVLSVTDQAASSSTLYVWVKVLADGTTPLISGEVRKSITFAA